MLEKSVFSLPSLNYFEQPNTSMWGMQRNWTEGVSLFYYQKFPSHCLLYIPLTTLLAIIFPGLFDSSLALKLCLQFSTQVSSSDDHFMHNTSTTLAEIPGFLMSTCCDFGKDIFLIFLALAVWRFLGPPSAAAAAKSLQSCPTLYDPVDGSPPGSAVPRILQARTLEWVAISFSNTWKWKVKVKSLSRVWLFATPWTAAYQAPPSMESSRQEYWSGVPLPSLGPPSTCHHWHAKIFQLIV